MTVFTDSMLQKFMEWSDLIEDPTEIRPLTDMRDAVQNLWESARRAAWQRMQFLLEELETESTLWRVSRGSGDPRDTRHEVDSVSSSSSRKSTSSSKETLLSVKAKRAALQQKLKFSDVIKDQEKMLAKLKLEQELSKTVEQEAIYQKADKWRTVTSTASHTSHRHCRSFPTESRLAFSLFPADRNATASFNIIHGNWTMDTHDLTASIEFYLRPASLSSTFLTTPAHAESLITIANNSLSSMQPP